mmetsp:Transcript_11182/g.41751  ORF Transcript_11182/g.41751 Transcript_11182/m.41751 type:complete len:145 (-) Transcript_11182:842-1276(-)
MGVTTEVVLGENEQKLLDTYGLGRGMRLLSLLDAFLLILYVILNSVFFFALFWGPVCGFIGASKYRTGWIRAYVVYFVLRCLMDAVWVILGQFWFIISFFVNCWLLRYVVVFLRLLQSCTDAELDQLRNPATAYNRARPYFVVF